MGTRQTRRVVNENDIARCVRRALDGYFRDLDGERPGPLHDMVMACAELPLLEYVLELSDGNQTLAADLLGMNRNTLRKKMKNYGLL
ncbi:MAG: Fis family transcriptional regulator [Betaproteobacteria bacterium]|nr:Fis family transcriptional regulator [Betaproteobacteria bacterium]